MKIFENSKNRYKLQGVIIIRLEIIVIVINTIIIAMIVVIIDHNNSYDNHKIVRVRIIIAEVIATMI